MMTYSRHLVSIAVAIALAVGLAALLGHFVSPHNFYDVNQILLGDVVLATRDTQRWSPGLFAALF
jgi:hypothetical protein